MKPRDIAKKLHMKVEDIYLADRTLKKRFKEAQARSESLGSDTLLVGRKRPRVT